MKRMLAVAALLLAQLGPSLAAPSAIEITDPLPATTMLRTLHAVQDRIATGDGASLPLQKHLLNLLASSILELANNSIPEALAQEKNSAIVLFALSGGPSDTARRALATIAPDEPLRALAHAVADSIGGRRERALRRFSKIELSSVPVSLVPYVALAKGQLVALSDVESGLALLTLVGQLAPGTLLEEAALRRKLQLALQAKMPVRFYAAARQYAYRFIGSPYRATFAQTLQQAAVEFPEHEPLLDSVLELLPEDLRLPMHVRIARAALLAGRDELARKMVQFVDVEGRVKASALRIQSQFVDAITRLTGADVKNQRDVLSGLDRRFLSAEDKALSDAAVAIADTILAPVATLRGGSRPTSENQLPIAAVAQDLLTAVDATLSRSEEKR